VSVILPDPLRAFVLERIVAERRPAYMRIGLDGVVVEWAGDWHAYGIENLVVGERAAERAPFIAELPTRDVEPFVLPSVSIGGAREADVYVVPDDDGEWVLLLDASAAARYQRIGQQAANELALLREAYEKLRSRSDKPSE